MFRASRVVKLCEIVLTVLCFALSSAPAYAASLGKLEVRSKLYEPFEARIALRGVKAGELDTMRVSLADDAAFERLGLVRSMVLLTLRFKIVASAAGHGYVMISSHERVREPTLSFIVEASSVGVSGTTMQRRYDALLDLN
ncbi:MAG: pilus assembly protein FimV [Gammaproteobacteria bacterium]|jgi:pilus assembly protein FimV